MRGKYYLKYILAFLNLFAVNINSSSAASEYQSEHIGNYKDFEYSYEEAMSTPDYKRVAQLLKDGLNPNSTINYRYETLLLTACRDNDAKLVDVLISAGAKPNVYELKIYNDQSPLYHAVENNNLTIINKLLMCCMSNDSGLSANEKKHRHEAIAYSAKKKQFKTIDALISDGFVVASKDIKEPFIKAALAGDLELVKTYVSYLKGSEQKNVYNIDLITQQSLHIMALKNDYKEIFYWFISHGADINSTDNNNEGVLAYAFRHNDIELAKFAVNKGANVVAMIGYSHSPRSLLAEAADSNNIEFVRLVLQTYKSRRKWLQSPGYPGIDINPYRGIGSPLEIAAKNGNAEMIRLLLAHGAKAFIWEEDRLPAHYAISSGSLESLKLLLDAGTPLKLPYGKLSLLYYAISFEKEDIARYLISIGDDVNSDLDTDKKYPSRSEILDSAITNKMSVSFIQHLIDSGVDIHTVDSHGRSYALYSLEDLQAEVLQVLINAGFDVNQVSDEGATLLTQAMLTGRSDLVSVLLNNGTQDLRVTEFYQDVFNENTANLIKALKDDPALISATKGFESPLYIAVVNQRYKSLNILLQHGANINAFTADGYTLLQLSIRMKMKQMTDVLLEHGADPDIFAKYNALVLKEAIDNQNEYLVGQLLKYKADVLLHIKDGSGGTYSSALRDSYNASSFDGDKENKRKAIFRTLLKASFPVTSNDKDRAKHFVSNMNATVAELTDKAYQLRSKELLRIAKLAYDDSIEMTSSDKYHFNIQQESLKVGQDKEKLKWLAYFLDNSPLKTEILLAFHDPCSSYETYSAEVLALFKKKGMKSNCI